MKRVLLGVTGCIAAYKSCEILRLLQKAEIDVKVIMTEHATHFVDPLTFRSLSHHEVPYTLFDNPMDPIHHISLAKECDLFLIAPCTANVMAKIAHGIADDLLTTTALACTKAKVIAPAMNVAMYENPATQENMEILKKRGYRVLDADKGYLACGDTGSGKLPDVRDIADYVIEILDGIDDGRPSEGSSLPSGTVDSISLARSLDLKGKRVIVTAGPTVEPIDAVRFISNYSSGKMGYSIAEAARLRGAEVVLISGPVSLEPPEGVSFIKVKTAEDMLREVDDHFDNSDIAIFTAAVADVRPKHGFTNKLKKGMDDDSLKSIELVENPDILKTMAARKHEGQFVVGFAAETDDVIEYGKKKLDSKSADMIVANEVGNDKGFDQDHEAAWLIMSDEQIELPDMSKIELAHRIFDQILK